MWKTLIIGNVLYAACVAACWYGAGGGREKLVPAGVYAGITFAAGIATGIVASSPGKTARKGRRRKATSVPRSFEFTK